MGVDYTTYVGPYFECKTRKAGTAYNFSSCTQDCCKNYMREYLVAKNFCEECGHPISEVTATKLVNAVDTYQVMLAVKERIAEPLGEYIARWCQENNTDIWLANIRNKWRFNPLFQISVQSVDFENISADIAEFTDQYRNELSILRNYYGLENVTIKWGIIHAIH